VECKPTGVVLACGEGPPLNQRQRRLDMCLARAGRRPHDEIWEELIANHHEGRRVMSCSDALGEFPATLFWNSAINKPSMERKEIQVSQLIVYNEIARKAPFQVPPKLFISFIIMDTKDLLLFILKTKSRNGDAISKTVNEWKGYYAGDFHTSLSRGWANEHNVGKHALDASLVCEKAHKRAANQSYFKIGLRTSCVVGLVILVKPDCVVALSGVLSGIGKRWPPRSPVVKSQRKTSNDSLNSNDDAEWNS